MAQNLKRSGKQGKVPSKKASSEIDENRKGENPSNQCKQTDKKRKSTEKGGGMPAKTPKSVPNNGVKVVKANIPKKGTQNKRGKNNAEITPEANTAVSRMTNECRSRSDLNKESESSAET